MNPFDDDDLIDRLQSGIAGRQAGISAPDGIGDEARRTARKRTATRAIGAGVPALAAAGAAAVLVTSSGSGSKAASGSGAGVPAPPAPAVSGGSANGQDTAYIIKRVKAKVAEDGASGTVIRAVSYAGGDVTPNGSLVNVGAARSAGYDYSAPDGTFYQRNVGFSGDGSSTGITGIGVTGPVVNGRQSVALTVINRTNHTYSQTEKEYSVPADAPTPTGPSVGSSPAQVQQALQSGQATELGTTTVNGEQAIALSIKVTGIPDPQSIHYTLYVDAQTYEPLGSVTLVDGNPDPYVTDWIPATTANIARAKDASIPAGYTKVDHLAG